MGTSDYSQKFRLTTWTCNCIWSGERACGTQPFPWNLTLFPGTGLWDPAFPLESDSISRYAELEIRRILRRPAAVEELTACWIGEAYTHTRWHQVWETFSIHTSDNGITNKKHKEKDSKDFPDLLLYKIHTVDVKYRQNDTVSTSPRGKPGNHYYQISDKGQNKAPYTQSYGFSSSHVQR